MNRVLLSCGCACTGVCVCGRFTGPEQIRYLHTCMSAWEHLCKHLYHGKRMQLPGHKQRAQRHLESVPEAGVVQGESRQERVLRAWVLLTCRRCAGQGASPACPRVGKAALLRCCKMRPPPKDSHPLEPVKMPPSMA